MAIQGEQDGARRILSIDGGGIVGTFPAAFLATLEENLQKPIGSYFDLIAGTSTGGIIALGLAMGLPAARILDLYVAHGPAIFGQEEQVTRRLLARVLRPIRWLHRPKYEPDALRRALEEVFEGRQLGHARTRLLIPAWNPEARSVYIYKTAHHERLSTDYKALAVDVALATSAAPSYFPQHITSDSVGLIDGGIWANNPTGLAVVEAIGMLRWPADSLNILSLGCLDNVYTLAPRGGVGRLLPKLAALFMDGQSKGSMGIAKLLTGHGHERKALYRIDYTMPQGRYTLDDTSAIPTLIGLGKTQARDAFPQLRSVFFTSPAGDFFPVYKLAPFRFS